MPKNPLTSLLIFWACYLCVPALRDNWKMLCYSRGTALSDVSFGGLNGPPGSLGANDALDSPYSDSSWQRLTLYNAPQKEVMASYSDDPEVLAWWLGSQPVAVNIIDITGNSIPDPDNSIDVLKVCRRGEAIDPGNAFFPAMAAQAELFLRSKAKALADLRRAAACPRYDDYASHYFSESLTSNPAGVPNRASETYYFLWTRHLALDSIGDYDQVPENQFASKYPGPEEWSDFELETLLLRVARLRRLTSSSENSRGSGAFQEFTAIYPNFCIPTSNLLSEPPDHAPEGGASQSRLMRDAMLFNRPDVARLVRSEWAVVHGAHVRTPETVTAQPECAAAALCALERVERLILWSMPLPILLLVVNWRMFRPRQSCGPTDSWSCFRGAELGLLTLSLLFAGDLVIAASSSNNFMVTLGCNYLWGGPGLPAAMPAVAALTVGVVLIAAAWNATLRAELVPTGPDDRARQVEPDFAGAKFAFACRWLVWFTFLGSVITTFFVACDSVTWPAIAANPFFAGHGVPLVQANPLVAEWYPVLVILLAAVLFAPWCLAHLPDRRRANAAARVRLVNVAAGYLVAATVLFGGLELIRFPIQMSFDAAVARVIQNGG